MPSIIESSHGYTKVSQGYLDNSYPDDKSYPDQNISRGYLWPDDRSVSSARPRIAPRNPNMPRTSFSPPIGSVATTAGRSSSSQAENYVTIEDGVLRFEMPLKSGDKKDWRRKLAHQLLKTSIKEYKVAAKEKLENILGYMASPFKPAVPNAFENLRKRVASLIDGCGCKVTANCKRVFSGANTNSNSRYIGVKYNKTGNDGDGAVEFIDISNSACDKLRTSYNDGDLSLNTEKDLANCDWRRIL